MSTEISVTICRYVFRGGNLVDQLSLFKPGWAEYAPHTTAIPPGFKKLSTFTVMVSNVVHFVHSKRVVCMNFYNGVITITIIIKRWSEAESFTIFENHAYSH